MIGYTTCNINANNFFDKNDMHAMIIRILDDFLKDNNMPLLSSEEKKYVNKTDEWIMIMYKKHLQKTGGQ